GIRYVGETTAKSVARHFRNVDALLHATNEELLEVGDVGEVIAASILDYFSKPENVIQIGRLKEAGLNFDIAQKERKAGSDVLAGKTIVISGNFSVSRDRMKEMIEENGGKNSSSVSGKTSFLLAGEKPGPEKIRKAQENGVRIIGEEEFLSILGGAASGPAAESGPQASETEREPKGQLSLF
ncbi:MAG: helix-hairpin-helix domain-containing protein, partial [Candidatus Cryptobacteroides sp.]